MASGGISSVRIGNGWGQIYLGFNRRFLAPDGTERYCVDEAFLMNLTAKLGGQLVDPIKTTVVQNQRCMTTWVLRKLIP